MKISVKKWMRFFYLIMGVIMVVTMIGCKKEKVFVPEPGNANADQSSIYGMCYLLEERENPQIEKEVLLMKNMGVKSVRQWMHFSHFMSDPSTIKKGKNLNDMHLLIDECEKAGMVNIGMNHHNFCTTRSKLTPTSKPFARDISKGSEYVKWLEDYYLSWKTLVQEFPTVMYWEIDNEVNNPDFMSNNAPKGSSEYSVKQMAEIATDMFYYGSRGIHDGNPSAMTVMGGLTEPKGLGRGNTANFLQMLYDNIFSGEYGYFYNKEESVVASKDPDDYFQVACWHPYMYDFDIDKFININNSYYQVILKNEKKHKNVFFTEMGWNDEGVGGEQVAMEYLEGFYQALKSMKYVQITNIFKLYDTGKKNNWDGNGYLYYGFIHDPHLSRKYTPCASSKDQINIDKNGYCITGAPKNKAYLFQKLAGGTGSLDVLVK